MCAIAAVDTVLWDIKAKSLNVPLYQLLGGASREAVLVYGHSSGRDADQTVESFARFLDLGYRAVRAQSGIPVLSAAYGIGRGGVSYEPAEKGAPKENPWSAEHYLRVAPQLFARLRKDLARR